VGRVSWGGEKKNTSESSKGRKWDPEGMINRTPEGRKNLVASIGGEGPCKELYSNKRGTSCGAGRFHWRPHDFCGGAAKARKTS